MPVCVTTRVVSNDPWVHVAAIAAAQTRARAVSKVVRFAIMMVSRCLLPIITLCHRPAGASVTGITVFRFAKGGIEAAPTAGIRNNSLPPGRPPQRSVGPPQASQKRQRPRPALVPGSKAIGRPSRPSGPCWRERLSGGVEDCLQRPRALSWECPRTTIPELAT